MARLGTPTVTGTALKTYGDKVDAQTMRLSGKPLKSL